MFLVLYHFKTEQGQEMRNIGGKKVQATFMKQQTERTVTSETVTSSQVH